MTMQNCFKPVLIPCIAGGLDYEPLVNLSLVIPFNTPIGDGICQDLTIIGDDPEEENEIFLVTFTAHPTLNPEDIVTGQSLVSVTIVDNGDIDGMCITVTGRIVYGVSVCHDIFSSFG